MPSILIGPSSFAQIDKRPLQKLTHAGFQVIPNPYGRKLLENELKELLGSDVCGIIAGLEPLNQQVLQGSNVKVISRVGAGLSNVDLKFCKQSGIKVLATPNGPTEAVAELTIAALLGMLRMIPRMDAALHQGRWGKMIGTQLQGKTVAIVGYGRIGRRVAELLRPFAVTLVVADPQVEISSLTDERLLPLEELLPLADIITFHNSGEACLVGEAEIARMKAGVFLLNVARGGVISERALAEGIKSGKIAGAWLDTFAEEPYRGPLADFPQVILTPHVGSYTAECRSDMENEAVDNLLHALYTAI